MWVSFKDVLSWATTSPPPLRQNGACCSTLSDFLVSGQYTHHNQSFQPHQHINSLSADHWQLSMHTTPHLLEKMLSIQDQSFIWASYMGATSDHCWRVRTGKSATKLLLFTLSIDTYHHCKQFKLLLSCDKKLSYSNTAMLRRVHNISVNFVPFTKDHQLNISNVHIQSGRSWIATVYIHMLISWSQALYHDNWIWWHDYQEQGCIHHTHICVSLGQQATNGLGGESNRTYQLV